MPVSHVLIKVSTADYAKVVTFYSHVLKPLGMEKLAGFPAHMTAFGAGGPQFVIAFGEGVKPSNVHVAFAAADEAAVEEFHTGALELGGKDNGAPGRRANIHPSYHAAFVLDPVGNNIEAGCMVSGGNM